MNSRLKYQMHVPMILTETDALGKLRYQETKFAARPKSWLP